MRYLGLTIATALLASVILFVSCSQSSGPDAMFSSVNQQGLVDGNGDVESAKPLVGEYVGRYHYISNYYGQNQMTEVYEITWRFSGNNYWLGAANPYHPICEAWGHYQLNEGISFVQMDDGTPCTDPDRNPTGPFTLRQPMDSVVMMQVNGDICKQIILVPAEDD